ncbi:hypothetical protein PoB_007204900 [Plakobranchus ocellatus]|uniref:Uncharacterized protein n=1 Tax=Plakobranchus ocellatus TaxID=259542 RepID=A0AAV4DMZ2_9GAST|nr:hypothetical protein PoB_007204900 [Plakobranchus ocellatus]
MGTCGAQCKEGEGEADRERDGTCGAQCKEGEREADRERDGTCGAQCKELEGEADRERDGNHENGLDGLGIERYNQGGQHTERI